MKEILLSVIEETVIVAGQMSLYLLFGFLVAGFLYILAPSTWIQRHLGGKGRPGRRPAGGRRHPPGRSDPR